MIEWTSGDKNLHSFDHVTSSTDYKTNYARSIGELTGAETISIGAETELTGAETESSGAETESTGAVSSSTRFVTRSWDQKTVSRLYCGHPFCGRPFMTRSRASNESIARESAD